jgi:hypothetical protein
MNIGSRWKLTCRFDSGWCFCKMDEDCYWRSSGGGYLALAMFIYIGIGLVIAGFMDWYSATKKEVEAEILKSSKGDKK